MSSSFYFRCLVQERRRGVLSEEVMSTLEYVVRGLLICASLGMIARSIYYLYWYSDGIWLGLMMIALCLIVIGACIWVKIPSD